MSAPYLEIKGLKKTYSLKPILRGIDVVLDQGKCMALLGANGAGKTTLLRILACLTKPGAGIVRIGGLDIGQEAQRIRLLVGFVGHQPNLYDELTVIENLLFFGRMYSVKKAHERAVTLLKLVGLAQRSSERVGTLSRGQLQRLSLARALLHSPRLLLLDEPDAGLDDEGIELLEELIREHTEQGGTTLFTTHNFERAVKFSDLICMLSGGRVVYQQATTSLEAGGVRLAYQEALR
ncbi:MAG TPA: heme ABC exporter ATP-binding protein CcmA [Ktedonobacteraceae bacterium]